MEVGLFRLAISLQEGSYPPEPLPPQDDAAYSEEEICGFIFEALSSRQLTGVRPDQLRIEFLLPTSLIDLPIDQWRVGATFLGVQCKVVVRRMTRLLDLTGVYRHYWRQKWSKVRQTELLARSALPMWNFTGRIRPPGSPRKRQARDHALIFASLITEDGPVCVLLADAPTSDQRQALRLP